MTLSRRKFLTGAAAVVAVAAVKPVIPPGAYVRELPVWVPKGWLIPDGRTLLKADYGKLWAVIGGAYGHSETTFNLPDFGSAVEVNAPAMAKLFRASVPLIATGELDTTLAGMITYYHVSPQPEG